MSGALQAAGDSSDASRWLCVQRLRRRPPSQGCGVAALSPQDDVLAPGSLRSARRQHDGSAMSTTREPTTRNERLYVRLTPDEAAHVADLADARGLTVSDFVRAAVLRGLGGRPLGRRVLPSDTAGAIRQLGVIAADLGRLARIAQANGPIRQDELDACLAQVRAAIAVFGP